MMVLSSRKTGCPLGGKDDKRFSFCSHMALVVKNPPTNAGEVKRYRFDPWVRKIPLEEGMATHSSVLAWRIPWTAEPDGLQSIVL